jgi:DNA-binding SARP family transcriptional activator
MTNDGRRRVGIVGRLGVYPVVHLTLPARRVIAYLALQDHPVSRARAAAELWLDVSDAQARANLRRALWQVPRGWVIARDDELILDADADLADARRIAASALDGGALTLADIELLSSDILPGWHEEWLLSAQDSFHLLRVQALEAACRTMAANGKHALAAQAGRTAVAAEPLRESAVAALIEACLAESNRYHARECYLAFKRRLKEELGVAPEPAMTARLAALGLGEHGRNDGAGRTLARR